MEAMEEVVDSALNVGGRVVTALIILAVGYLIAVVVRRVGRRLLDRPPVRRVLGPSLVRLLSDGAYYVLLALTVGLGLIALGVSATFVSAVGLVLLALLALALHQSISNFAATVGFLMFQPFVRGDLISTMGQIGLVQEILPFSTVLLRPDDRLVSLPNSKIQDSGVENYTRLGRVLADVELSVGYGVDISRARLLITEIVAGDHRILADPPLVVAIVDLAAIGVNLLILAPVAPADYWAVRSDLRERIKARFDTEGIQFAVPPLDVRLLAATPVDPVRAPHHEPRR